MASLPLNVFVRSRNLSCGRLDCIPPSRPSSEFRRRSKALTWDLRTLNPKSSLTPIIPITPKKVFLPNASPSSGCNFRGWKVSPMGAGSRHRLLMRLVPFCKKPKRLDKKIFCYSRAEFCYRGEQYGRAFGEFAWDYPKTVLMVGLVLMTFVGSALMTLVGAPTLFSLAIFLAFRIIFLIQKRRWASVLEEIDEKIKVASKTQDTPEEKSSIKTEMGIPLEIVDDSPKG